MKLTKKQKIMIKVLQLAHNNIKLGEGLCFTLDLLCYNDKITNEESKIVRAFMLRYFSSDIGRVWWLSEYDDCGVQTKDTLEYTPDGLRLRKDLFLNAIEFIKATGITK